MLADKAATPSGGASPPTLAALVRTMVQQGGGTAALDALLSDQGSVGSALAAGNRRPDRRSDWAA